MTTRERIVEWSDSVGFEGLLLADGFDDALVGVTEKGIAIYALEDCVKILMLANEWAEEEAWEWLEYNCVDAYVGPKSPLYIHTFPKEN
jgi:hypothetical protein